MKRLPGETKEEQLTRIIKNAEKDGEDHIVRLALSELSRMTAKESQARVASKKLERTSEDYMKIGKNANKK
jgi:hypothetical protein